MSISDDLLGNSNNGDGLTGTPEETKGACCVCGLSVLSHTDAMLDACWKGLVGVYGSALKEKEKSCEEWKSKCETLQQQINTLTYRWEMSRVDRDIAESTVKVLREELKKRYQRQSSVAKWCEEAFGKEQANYLPQRGLRLLEEAAEAAQAAGVSVEMAHKQIDYVWGRPPGELEQKIGQVGVTTLALANAAWVSAEDCENKQVERVLSVPIEHFREWNKAKNEDGFYVVSSPTADRITK